MSATTEISFVVPTKNSARTIEACLRSIRAQEGVELELLVTDNSSTDPTQQIAAQYADEVLVQGPERSAQRNAGFERSGAPIVVFVDSDMVLEPRVGAEIVEAMSADPVVGALVIPERAFGKGFLARCRALEKELYLGDPAVEAARAFRRSALDQVGGYDTGLTGPEDWELPDRVVQAGWTLGRTTSQVWHDEGGVRLLQQFGKKRYYGRGFYHYRRQISDAPARPVARRSLAQPKILLRKPLQSIGLAVLKLSEVLGLASGYVDEAVKQYVFDRRVRNLEG